MCLILLRDENTEFMRRLNESKKGEITCWKVYEKGQDRLNSIIMNSTVESPGVIQSGRESSLTTNYEKRSGEIQQAIHVFTTRKKAEEVKYYDYDVIAPVLCKKTDLIGQGDNEDAAFSEVRIEKRTWNKIFAKKI